MNSSGKSAFGAAFFFGGFALLLFGAELWFSHASLSSYRVTRALEAMLMVVGAAIATSGIRVAARR